MAIKENFPNISPSLNLDFANTRLLDPRITFTRASTARVYDGKTVAKAEENLLLRSQEFQTGWNISSSGTSLTIVANATAAPDGTTTAEELENTATTTQHRISQSVSLATSTTFSMSVFAKNVDAGFLAMSLYDDASFTRYAAASFDIATGVVGTTSASGTGYSVVSSSITSAGNGWYRCVMVVTSGTTLTTPRITFAVQTASTLGGNFGIASAFLGAGESIYLWGAQLEQRSAVTAYTATTTQPITNYVPVLQSAANNVARFDHNPVTGESLGLLIEEQRTNLLLRSEEFDNASWAKSAVTVTANQVIAPDGTLTSDKLIESATTAIHKVDQLSGTVVSGAVYTFSVFAKAGERTFMAMQLDNTLGGGFCFFNLTNGTVGTSGALTGTPSITPVGNGWYRCAISSTTTATTSRACIIYVCSADGVSSYAGDGYSGIFIWGAQLEAGAFPTSYIPTVASQVTRSADAASMTGANFSSWFRADEGTLYGEAVTRTNVTIFTAWDGTQNNRVAIASRASGINGSSGFVIYNNTVQTAFTFTHANNNKVALAYANNDVATTLNGAAVQSDTSASIPSTNQAVIGFDGAARVTGWIRKLAYYPKRLANAEIVALTAS